MFASANSVPTSTSGPAQSQQQPRISRLPLNTPGDRPRREPGLTELAGYRIRAIRSRGQGCNVYRARSNQGRRVALKVLPGRRQRQNDWAERFEREARIAVGLKHPHLIEVLDFTNDRGCDVLVMEYAKGKKLSRWLKERGPMDETQAVKIVLALADALSACHAAGLVHNNVCPDNVLLTAAGKVKLISYGFSRPVEEQKVNSRRAAYLAPELFQRRSVADARSDVYALGALLYTLVTGAAPFDDDERVSMSHRKRFSIYPSARELVSQLSTDVAEAIERAMSVDPLGRPQTVETFTDMLSGYCETVGDYRLMTEVGRGAMGRVYRARTADGQTVAVKILHSHLAENERMLVRFYQEAKLAMEMSHPNLVPAYEVGCDQGKHFIAMEYVGGDNLKNVIKSTGPMPESRALKIAYDVAKALDALHKRGLLHRDVKPGNILLDAGGNARLADLGLAKQEEVNYELTRAGCAMGTMQYAPPEQFRDAKTVDQTADVYALGVTLYQMITGASPFPAKSTVEQLIRKTRNDYVPPEKVVPEITEQTRNLIRAAMHENPEKRPRSAKAFAKVAAGFRACPADSPMAAETATEPLWQVVFVGADGEVNRVSGTATQIRKLIRAGRISSDGRAARGEGASYAPLADIPELQPNYQPPQAEQPAPATNGHRPAGGFWLRLLACIGITRRPPAAEPAGICG